MVKQQNYINHIALVTDKSYSMAHLREQVIKVADAQVAYLALRSTELNQETRITEYVFDDEVECVVYDKDVLRLPSIREHYQIGGNTALIDATLKALDDLALTPEIYGEHAFLVFVLTDGQENRSKTWNKVETLRKRLANLPGHWTVAVLVPDQTAKFEAKKFGFHPDNIAIWDTTTVRGLTEAGEKIKQATDNFMKGRESGIRGSRNIFSTGVDAVNTTTVKENLQYLKRDTYKIFDVKADGPVRPFVEAQGHTYRIGGAYYQLTKTETIQPQKQIVVRDKRNGNLYSGRAARDLVGLSSTENERVKPDHNPLYDVFVQSTSVNRKLLKGTRLIYFPETVSV